MIQIQRLAVTVLINLAIHDDNKPKIAFYGGKCATNSLSPFQSSMHSSHVQGLLYHTFKHTGIEALVAIQGHDDANLRTLTAQLLELLADVKSTEEVTDRTLDMGVEQLMKLCLVENEPIQVRYSL